MTIRTILICIGIAFLPVLGYMAMYVLTYALPVADGNAAVYALFAILLIALGMAVPYWMLKLGMHSAHRENPREKEMTLKDLPKDKDDLERDLAHRPR